MIILLPHNLFDDQADLYVQARPRYPQAIYAYLASLCQEHAQVWDCACGNGQVAVDLSRYFPHVQASDVSEGQIRNAILHPNVAYSVQAAESTCFSAHQFDLICVAQALHWLNYERFWPGVQRILKPDGVFAAWGYTWLSVTPEIDGLIQELLLKPIDPYWAAQNQLLWDHYRNVPFPLTRLDPPQITMTMAWELNALFAYLRSWSAVRRAIAAQGDEFLQKTFEAVSSVWGWAGLKRKIQMEFVIIVGKNKK